MEWSFEAEIDEAGRLHTTSGYLFSPEATWKIAQAIDEGRDQLVEPLSDEFLSNCGGRVIARVNGGIVEFIGGAVFGRRRLADLDAWISRHRDAGNIQ